MRVKDGVEDGVMRVKDGVEDGVMRLKDDVLRNFKIRNLIF